MTDIKVGDRVRMTQIIEGPVVQVDHREITIRTENEGDWLFELPWSECQSIEVLPPEDEELVK